jgi:hypothetical protein
MTIPKQPRLTGDRNQCPGCLGLFNSSKAFDKHRTGDHANNGRRCFTPAEMLARGMSKGASGFWITQVFKGIPAKPLPVALQAAFA